MQKNILIILFFILFLTACVVDNHGKSDLKSASLLNTELGVQYLQQEQFARAKEKLLLALDQDPNSAEAWVSMGYFLLETNDLEHAEDYYLKALEFSKDDGRIYNHYGVFLCRTGRYQEAIKEFELAQKDPAYIHANFAKENAKICADKIKNKNE